MGVAHLIHHMLFIFSKVRILTVNIITCIARSSGSKKKKKKKKIFFSIPVMMFHATFNNISVISWRSGLVVGRNRRPSASHWQTLSHNVVVSRHRHERGNFSGDKRVKWVNEKRKFIQGLLLKIGVSFTVYPFLLQKILNYRTFNINLYIES